MDKVEKKLISKIKNFSVFENSFSDDKMYLTLICDNFNKIIVSNILFDNRKSINEVRTLISLVDVLDVNQINKIVKDISKYNNFNFETIFILTLILQIILASRMIKKNVEV